MVKALLTDTKNVGFPGVKTKMIVNEFDQKEIGSVLFVRLNPRNRSLVNIACEDNPNAPIQFLQLLQAAMHLLA